MAIVSSNLSGAGAGGEPAMRGARARTGMADAAGDHGRAIRGRRRLRRDGARVHAAHERKLAPAGHRRERRRRRGYRGDAAGRQGSARRLCLFARQRRHARLQRHALQEAAVSTRQRFRAGGAVRRAGHGARRPEGFSRQQPAGIHRLREGERGHAAIRLRRRRLDYASCLRAAQRRHRLECHPRSLSRRRAGDGRSHRSNTANSLPQIMGKTIKPIALLSHTRSPLLPSLATAQEQGLADFEAITWNAFFLPKGTPAAIVNKLNAAVVDAMESPAVKERMKPSPLVKASFHFDGAIANCIWFSASLVPK
ncbi:MAG: hypothetical protein E6G96_18530 [Alphaproteobacteria bacterium]|nr:MAG: hypothetical protein E6G96_18530 [Alphaproteobacteria bacterium]